jgi:orotate phosphoribosyltransferase
MNKSLTKLLSEKNIIKYGNFTLRSGISASYYCDIKEVFGYPEILMRIIDELLKLIPKNSTCIAGSGYGGITLASLVAYKKNLPLVLVRDKVKNHGIKKVIDGYIPNKKDVVCIIDDVYTTGSSISDTMEKLSVLNVTFTKPVVVLNRSKKRTILSLLIDKDLL